MSFAYGRQILRGAIQYANLQRRWLIFRELQLFLDRPTEWPHLDGLICAGFPHAVFAKLVQTYPHIVYCAGGGDPTICPVVALDDITVGIQAAEHLMDCHLEHFLSSVTTLCIRFRSTASQATSKL